MNEKNLFSIAGLFDSSDDIMHAAEIVEKEGYKKYDVNTPFPVHGLETKMKLSPSKLGYFALVLGLTGASAALFFMWWSMSKDYPMIIGGKPFFALPAFIPIAFEVTVLTASVGTVLTMLFLFFRLPNLSHPLHDTNYMKKVSDDKFGISIEAADPMFDSEKVKNLLKSLNAKNIEEIYFEEKELSDGTKIFSPKFILFLAVTAVLISGVTYFTLNILLFMNPFNFMEEQDRFNPEAQTTFFKDTRTMRLPPLGTVARGAMPYMFAGQPDLAGEKLVNPLMPDAKTLAIGKEKFDTYCSPCHDYLAKGNSRLRGQFPNPPSLHSEKVRNWTDGRIFHVITEGQNSMPSYVQQLEPNERWAVILYLRALQRAMNAKEGDLK
jgi:mono/diheme cytochrome c family protein